MLYGFIGTIYLLRAYERQQLTDITVIRRRYIETQIEQFPNYFSTFQHFD